MFSATCPPPTSGCDDPPAHAQVPSPAFLPKLLHQLQCCSAAVLQDQLPLVLLPLFCLVLVLHYSYFGPGSGLAPGLGPGSGLAPGLGPGPWHRQTLLA